VSPRALPATDLSAVLGAIARTAAQLCDARDALIYLLDGDQHRLMAKYGTVAQPQRLGDTHPVRRDTPLGRAVLDRRPVHVPDIVVARGRFGGLTALQLRVKSVRTVLAIPLLYDGVALGGIVIRRTRVQPFGAKQISLLKTFADQAAIAIENARLSRALEARHPEISEALEQQSATAEILSVISSSPRDIRPVFDAILAAAARLCGASMGGVYRYDGRHVHFVSHLNFSEGALEAMRTVFPREPRRNTSIGRAILDRAVVHIADVARDPDAPRGDANFARVQPHRSVVAVPMLRDGIPLGSIALSRGDSPFSERHIAVLKTFADQAVIAIENVRLFTELQARNTALTEALEQQTATSEILRAISRSPTNVQPVFEAIVRSAVRLCGAAYGGVYRFDGASIHSLAHDGFTPEQLEHWRSTWPRPITSSGPTPQAIRSRSVVRIADIEADSSFELSPETLANLRSRAVRSVLVVPMLRQHDVIGAISLAHQTANAFPDAHVELLKTFADQAVIAIENVRLFTELQARNRDLTTALDQQTATAEILRTLSRSYTDVRPVFQAIVDSATRLLRGHSAVLSRIVDDRIDLAAYTHTDEAGDALLESFFPVPLHSSGSDIRPIRERVIGERIPYHVADVETDPRVGERGRASARARGYRSQLVVPMLRDGDPIGALAVTRREPGAFTDEETALLQTFADQAVIAIENVRLFKELDARNRELTEALEQQTATSEILKAISGAQVDASPVFDAIARSAVKLCHAFACRVFCADGGMFGLVGEAYGRPEARALFQGTHPEPLGSDSPSATAAGESRIVQYADVPNDPRVPARYRERARARGYRALMCVPMMRDQVAIGTIAVARQDPVLFSEQQVQLIKTFADQAVIAIENVRLFTELQTRTRELTRSVQQLTALGEVGQAVSSTLDLERVLTTIASRASQLAGTDTCTVYEYDEGRGEFHLRATHGVDDRVLALTRVRPIRRGEGVGGRVAETRLPVQIEDVAEDAAYQGSLRDALLQAGVRSVLAIPLLREDRLSGMLIVSRKTTGRFAEEVVALLQTFGTQSAIAIQNARLYRELEAKGGELEAASRHKSQFLANMSHELRTPMNAIIGYTELIADGIYGAVPEPMRDVLTRVDASGRHLLGLINDVLDLSKIEAGQLTLSLSEYSMKEIVESVLAAADPLAAEKRLNLVIDLPPDLPTGRGDQRRLAQVLLNLVGNAIKFTDEGHVAVRVGAAAGMFVIAVSDTGPGIPRADQERIFEEFQQADTSHTRPKGGTGLGLAIARRIVTMHGGRIWVESTPGAGATFRITIPVRVEEQIAVRGARS
jgi:GAF domain-containing protein